MARVPGSTVLVTGAAGNIGSFIVDALVAARAGEIVCVDNLFNGRTENLEQHLLAGAVRFYNVDIADSHSLDHVFRTHRPRLVFHQASMLIQDSEALPHKAIQTNVVGTFNVVHLGNEHGIDKMCYASSASVFGEPKRMPVDEEHPLAFKDNYLYGATKIANEAIVGAHARFDWVGLRYYNVYSERQSRSAFYIQVMNYLFDRIEANEPVELHNDGSQTVDLIHAEDVASANLAAVEGQVSGELFNIGSGIETRVVDLARRLMDVMGRKVEIRFSSHRAPGRMVTRRQCATAKAERLLGFRSRVGLSEGLERFVAARRMAVRAVA